MASTCSICAILLLCITTNALMNLSTLFDGNGYMTPPGGNMFDVKNIGLTELTIERFCLHVNAGSSDNWDATIYTKSGTFFGSESNSAAWTTIHQESLTGGAGRWQATFLSNLQSPVSIAPLDTQAFFIRITNVRNYYSNSNAQEHGRLLANDSNLAIYEGNACTGFFTGASPRKWNGVIYYSLSTTMPTTNNPTTHMPTTAPLTTVPTTDVPTTIMPTTTIPTTTMPTTVMTDMATNRPTIKPTINDNEVLETTSGSGDFTQLAESKRDNLWLLFVLIGCAIGMIIILSVLYAKRRRNKLEKDKNNIEICVNSDSQHGTNSSPQSAICGEKLTTISTTANTAPHVMNNIQMQTVFDDDDDELYTTNANVEHETTKCNDRMDTRGEGDIDEDDQMYLNSPIQTTENNATNTGGLGITVSNPGQNFSKPKMAISSI